MINIVHIIYEYWMNRRFRVFKESSAQMPEDVSSIWLVRDDKIGDIIFLTPFPRLLKEKWPQATVTVMVNCKYKSIWEHNPYVDRIIELKRSFNRSKWVDSWELGQIAKQARSEKVDLLISFDHNRHIGYFCRWCQPGFSLGFALPKLPNQFWDVSFEETSLHRGGLLQTIATSLRLDISTWYQEIYWTASEETAASQLLGPSPEARIGLVPWTSASKKDWPLPFAAELCRRIKVKGGQIVLFGSTAESAKAEELIKLAGDDVHIVNCVGRTSILETAALLKQIDLLICCDTGIAHIAATVGCPAIVLYGPTAPEIWKPLSDRVVVLEGKRCEGCYPAKHRLGFAPNRMKCNYLCMNIQPDDIIEVMEEYFQK